ncbi:uncharacterized protein LOC125494708 [Beta vulgaris subsp. vulgaris]|uniref:uncharacterized protein LOC125494708 n=1 Tax=Beta vulgaris subsp. vulgaris TaxID=3555 RepID=UPI0020370A16|nr:uncharacterized protein LOC125494708 [Beta vulgaris subsp. vulgaris]
MKSLKEPCYDNDFEIGLTRSEESINLDEELTPAGTDRKHIPENEMIVYDPDPQEEQGIVSNIGSLREHIFRRGFRQDYHVCVCHGEEGIYDGGNAVVNVVHERGEFDVIENDENLEDEYENIEDDDDDRDHVKEMMEGVDDHAGKKPPIFECMAEASRKSLYPGCTRYTKLTIVITLFNIKTKAVISDSAFTCCKHLFGDMLLDDHELPKSNYYTKKPMCPFSLEYQRIHACPNDCVLYQNEYANMDECPRCGKSRYRRVGVGDKKGPPTKVMWYLPIIPRFKRMFSIKKDAKNLRWHAERRKEDDFLKHPADAPKWKGINRLHKTFDAEDRNLRLGLCTDGMNPFGTLSSQHRPKQLGNDINVYLQPLVDDLRKMWDEGVFVYDAHADEVKGIEMIFDKGASDGGKRLWKKESILWKLPYWKNLEVHPYLDEHMEELRDQNPGKETRALMQLHNKTFIDWFITG